MQSLLPPSAVISLGWAGWQLIAAMVGNAEPRKSEVEAARAKARSAERFGTG